MFTTVNDTAKKLVRYCCSRNHSCSRLNLPAGINLGSYFVAVDEMIPILENAANMLDQARERTKDLRETLEDLPWWYYIAVPAAAPMGFSKILKDFGIVKE